MSPYLRNTGHLLSRKIIIFVSGLFLHFFCIYKTPLKVPIFKKMNFGTKLEVFIHFDIDIQMYNSIDLCERIYIHYLFLKMT